MQRARNGRGRHGEHVDLLAHLLDAFFVAHAEALFFVDDEQAEVGELQVFREDAVGADEDVDFAGFRFLQNFFLLLRVAEAADHFDGDGKRPEALLESFVVLEGEDRGGREHGDLLVVADGLECRAHGDFRLAVADVAAEQAVHGLGRFHVAHDVGDGLRLVFGLVELEGVFELAHEVVARGERVALGHFAFGVELEQFVGHVFHGLAHAGFRLGPRLRAEMTERWLGAFGRTVFLNQVEARERDVEARAFGVFEQHEFGVAVALIDFFQALILADAVFDVDDVVSDLQVAEVGEERGDFRLLALRARSDGVGFVEQIARAEDGEVRVGEHHAVGDVGFGERGGEDFSGEVTGFVGVAFAAAGAAAQAEARRCTR